MASWEENYDLEYWEVAELELGPKPEDPHSEAAKEYDRALESLKASFTPDGRSDPIDIDHEFAQEGARFAVEEYNKTNQGEALELKRVVKAALRSLDIKLTIETSDGKFYVTDLILWDPPGFKFLSFTPVDNNPEI